MHKSEQINELAKALSAAQTEITGATKDSTNPHFKSKYADLAAIWDAVRGPLTKNKLAVTQCVEIQHEDRTLQFEKVDILVTTLMHESGQWIESVYPVRPVKNDPQGFMSALTYARRGALAAITGCPSIDDDGNAASEAASSQHYARTPVVDPLAARIKAVRLHNNFDYTDVKAFGASVTDFMKAVGDKPIEDIEIATWLAKNPYIKQRKE